MNPTPESLPAPESSRRRWFAGLAAMGGLGLAATQVPAQVWGGRAALDPQERARRLEYRIGRLVKDVGGTQDQKDRLVAIASAAVADLRPLGEQARQSRRRSMELLAGQSVDRAALEQQRVLHMHTAEARSRRMVQAMADAAEVLTPEQRVKAAERIKSRMQHRWGG